ncbi:flavin reductase family protein [Devosia sp. FJ2-5-3]|jgi:flavin reductase (DIM6/NTAB) family NADH-FMN oxidoreductase RutF|uniref:flavin reductase family protein n=1 Tax=Devosia sp. FJ2-5-3 TaxID=2976680 RepID=UPI0023D81B1D|nr:flavin reductase family protein [Devosia sp. FJ2-5-3]WEJ57033.1 flavin reductase family protein [Devosia sp. FJ2-5-3]
MDLDLNSLPLGERYKLLCGLVVPRPIALVTTSNEDGTPNAAPFSFFNVISHDPPMVVLGIDRRQDGTPKDTLGNIQRTGEFVVNLVSEAIAVPMNACATDFPPGHNELEEVGLDGAASTVVRPPRIVQSPTSLECRLARDLEFGAEGQRHVIIGDIVHVHIADGIVNERYHVDQDRTNLIGRMAGRDYVRTADRFKLEALHYKEWQGA